MDHGKTWDQIGVWQRGWPDKNVNKTHGIREAFLFLDSQSNLVAVYLYERQNEVHSPKLVQAISKDGGDNWDNATDMLLALSRLSGLEWRPSLEWVMETIL